MIENESLKFLSELFGMLARYDNKVIEEAFHDFNESSDFGQVKKLCELVISNPEFNKVKKNKDKNKLDLTDLNPIIQSKLTEIEVLLRASKYTRSKKELLQFLSLNQIQANARFTKDELIYLYIEKLKGYTEEELLKIKEQLSGKKSNLDIFAEMIIGNNQCDERGVIVSTQDEVKRKANT